MGRREPDMERRSPRRRGSDIMDSVRLELAAHTGIHTPSGARTLRARLQLCIAAMR